MVVVQDEGEPVVDMKRHAAQGEPIVGVEKVVYDHTGARGYPA